MIGIIRWPYTEKVLGEFDHLRLFRDVVDGGSVSRGAERHGITQSAASQHLRELEKRLGVRLLDRSTRPIDRKSTRLNSSHIQKSRMPSSA